MIYRNKNLNEISFPLGGIGSGSIGLAGNGRLKDWEIFNRPSKGSINGYTHIAVKAIRNKKSYVKVLNGDLESELTGQFMKKFHQGFGYGPSHYTLCGMPHFQKCEFLGEFPIAGLKFSDDMFPGYVEMTAFNPFIPLDELNSSLPAAFFEIKFNNNTDDDISYHAAFSVGNPFSISLNKAERDNGLTIIKMINSGAEETSVEYGDLTVATDSEDCAVQEYWYRGKWRDNIVSFWNEFSGNAKLKNREYSENGNYDMCSLEGVVTVKPHSSGTVRFVLAWNIPNNYNYWTPLKEREKDVTWKNYYATVFKNSAETAKYSLTNWESLYSRTDLFRKTLFSSTLDKSVIDAVSSNLSVLKSPTVLRLENGEFYGWEGVQEAEGSCEGTCQHVWNYAYALCFLFPKLERSIRELEFKYSTHKDGGMQFRLMLPLGREDLPRVRACLDGQMGAVIKSYREWKISGDDKWLEDNWENIRNVLEYAWSPENFDEWDRNKDGILEGRQHHTLDMELFGPSSWLQGFYLAALKCAAEMAEYLGKNHKAKEYLELYEKGYKWTRENLFNGEYFIQKVNLSDKKIPEHFDCMRYWNEETSEIKYQIGEGSSIDQMCAQWHANICGFGDLFDNEQRKTAVKNLYKNNFKKTMRNFANPWRIFSLNDESGSVICEYPEGAQKPKIPVPYCEETMTGFEYQMAGLLISEGMVDEGLEVVRAVRDRYNGSNRNPWNEFECGSNYARSMASFALLPIFSGFRFDLPNKKIGFNPVAKVKNFKCLWSLDSGWGYVKITDKKTTVKILEGYLNLSELELAFAKSVHNLKIDGKPAAFQFESGNVSFKECKITEKIELQYN